MIQNYLYFNYVIYVMSKRTISLPNSMIQYIKDTHMCVSKFLQEKLAEKIVEEGKADQYLKDIKRK